MSCARAPRPRPAMRVWLVGWLAILALGCGDPVAPSPAEAPGTPERGRESGVEKTDVAIVGGGLAGLLTAYELGKRGIRTHVLEMQHRLGGRVATAEYAGGLSAEYGMQELWEGNPLLDVARELGVELEEGLDAYSSVLLDGELHAFVQDTSSDYLASFMSPEERSALDAWMKRAATLLELAEREGIADPRVAELQGLSFQAWIEADASLSPKVAGWIRTTLACELATEWSQFSALFGLLEFRIFMNGGVLNFHVAGGNSRLVEALAGAIDDPITLDARVTSVRRVPRDSGATYRISYERDRRNHTLEADHVVLAIPWTHLHRVVLDPPLSADRWAAIRGLQLGQYLVVHLEMDASARPLWLVDGESPMPVLTTGPLGVIYGDVDQSEDRLVFSLLIYGAFARAFHMAPYEAKVDGLVRELDALWPGFSDHVRDAWVYPYHPAAVAVWPPGRSPLDAGSDRIRTPQDGLYLAGDWTYNAHSDGAARSALAVAASIASTLGR